MAEAEAAAADWEERCAAAQGRCAELRGGVAGLCEAMGLEPAGEAAQALLGAAEGVTDKNLMQFLGLVEQHISARLLVRAHGWQSALTHSCPPLIPQLSHVLLRSLHVASIRGSQSRRRYRACTYHQQASCRLPGTLPLGPQCNLLTRCKDGRALAGAASGRRRRGR